MNLGFFDSGLGGLLMAKAVHTAMPDMNIFYLGDTLHLPYGNRSEEAIYMYTRRAMDHMLGKMDCKLVVIACNTASAAALRKLQQQWLPRHYPGRNILGIVVPTLEAAVEQGYKKIGLIATNYIVSSNVYREELQKLAPSIQILQKATPLLVPLIENDGLMWAPPVLEHYLAGFKNKQVECLLLGCTHYPFLKKEIKAVLGEKIDVLSQDTILPAKLADYLERHPEYANDIGRDGINKFYVTDLTDNYQSAAQTIYGSDIHIEKTEFSE